MFVAFEGPIAVGKTTLAAMYAVHKAWPAIFEEFEGNEFLSDFYADQPRWALPMQLWFLRARHEQLSAHPFTNTGCFAADYAFIKNEVFAQMLLSGRELRLFSKFTKILSTTLGHPDLIVHLDATNAVLLQRIAMRGRPYEAHIDESYLDKLRTAYDAKLRSHSGSRIVRFDTSALDITSPIQLERLFSFLDGETSPESQADRQR